MWTFRSIWRSLAAAPPVLAALRGQVAAMDGDLALRDVETMEEVVDRQLASQRFYATLLGLFAALAVVLAAVGLYGVVAYLVSRRKREIGVRMAMSAWRGTILLLVLGQAVRPAAWGLVVGLSSAFVGSCLLRSLLFQVEPTDPVIYAGAAGLLAAVVTVATLLPTRAATRVDPVESLRAD